MIQIAVDTTVFVLEDDVPFYWRPNIPMDTGLVLYHTVLVPEVRTVAIRVQPNVCARYGTYEVQVQYEYVRTIFVVVEYSIRLYSKQYLHSTPLIVLRYSILY